MVETAEITREEIQAKLDKGERLTREEEMFVMAQPQPGTGLITEENAENPSKSLENANKQVDLKKSTGIKKPDKTATPEADKKEAEDTETGKDEKKPEKKAEPVKAQEKTEEKTEPAKVSKEKAERKRDIVSQVEQDLDKPDSKVEIPSDYSDSEKALFWELRRARKRAQTAEQERDVAKFENLKLKQQAPEKTDKEPKSKEDEGEDDSYLNKKQVQGIVKDAVESAVTNVRQEMNQKIYQMWDREARSIFDDYNEVMKFADQVAATPENQAEIKKAYLSGDNVALVIYDLVKQHPTYGKLFKEEVSKEDKAEIEAAERIRKENEEKEARIEKNANKAKTSGAVGGGVAGEIGEYTIEEIAKMEPAEFGKLPKQVREKFLMGDY